MELIVGAERRQIDGPFLVLFLDKCDSHEDHLTNSRESRLIRRKLSGRQTSAYPDAELSTSISSSHLGNGLEERGGINMSRS